MRKKTGAKLAIAILTLMSVFSVVYTMNQDLGAATNGNYYGPDDLIPPPLTAEDEATDFFLWRGHHWKIGYTNQDTGKSLIYYNIREGYNDSIFTDVSWYLENIAQQEHENYRWSYTSKFGELVNKQGAYLDTLKQISLSQYDQFSQIPNLNTWISDVDTKYSNYPLHYKSKGCDGKNYIDYPGYPNVCYVASSNDNPVAGIIVAFEIDAIPKTLVLKPTPPEEGYTYRKNIKKLTETGSIFATTETLVPITLSMPKGFAGTDANNFEIIDNTGKVVTETTGTKEYRFRVKENAPDLDEDGFLYAGTYNVCVNAKVAATDAEDSQSCGEIIVDKASPEVKFEKPDITKVKIGDEISESIITDMDPLKLSGDLSASYSLSEDTAGSGIKVENDANDATKFVIAGGTNANANLPATYTLTVTVPKNDIDNYNTATATKDILVYKGLEKLTWTPTKSVFEKADVTSGSSVGTLLAVDGLSNFKYELTSPADGANYNAAAAADNASFQVVSTSLGKGESAGVSTTENLEERAYHVQFKVTDATGESKYVDVVIQVGKKAQSKLEFKENNQTITSKTIYFDDTTQSVTAVGGESAISNLPTYGLSDPADGTYLTVANDGKLTPQAITGDGKTVKVKATKKGNDSFADVSAEIEITILPAKQTISFTDATDPKKIKLKTEDVVQDAKGVLTSDGKLGSGVGGITYTSSDKSVFTVGDDGKITTVGKGTATLTATLNANTNNAGYNKNYETASCQKTITVYDGMKFTWVAESATANKVQINDAVGTIKVEGNTGKVKFSIKEGNENFNFLNPEINPATLQWNKAITADDIKSNNEFKITIVATDDNGPQEYEVTIIVGLAENDFYFVKPADGKTKITTLSETYIKDKTVQLMTQTSNSGAVAYKLKDNEDASILSVNDLGKVTILKIGGPVIVEATVPAKDGYAAKTIELPITITKNTYESIAFVDPATTYVAYTDPVSSAQPATLTPEGEIAYSVEESTKDVCMIASNGTVTALKKGTCKIKASSVDENYEEISTSKDVIFFEGATGSFTQTKVPQAGSASATTPIGTAVIEAGGDSNTYTYAIHTELNDKNMDKDLFSVDDHYGTVSLGKEINADTLSGKTYDKDKDGYILHVQVDAMDSVTKDIVSIDCEIVVKGAPMNNVAFKGENGEATQKISKPYQKDGSFTVSLVNNLGGVPTYSFVSGPEDVINTTILGNTIDILNANEATIKTPVVIKAEIPAENGYEGTTVTCIVEITKAKQDKFKFTSDKITMLPGSSVDPTWSGVESGETPKLTKSDDKTIVTVTDTTITSLKKEGMTTITATVDGNRNYMNATAKTQVEVSEAQAYPFEIDLEDVTYGDDDIDLTANIITDEHTTGAITSQTWTSSDPTVAAIDENGNITILKAGETMITCKQTSSKDPDVSSSILFHVFKKGIKITIEDKEKRVGEAVPTFTVDIPVNDLVGNDTIEAPELTCVDAQGADITVSTPAGSYPITGNYETDAYPNYDITIADGSLSILQDEAQDAWYYLKGNDTKEKISDNTWVNEAVLVLLDKENSGNYDEISLDKENWINDQILVETEGTTITDVSFKNSVTNALATSKEAIIRIDTTDPEILDISGEEVEQNAISKLLNFLTFGAYFKPQDEITIHAKDIQKENVNEVSGLKEINYEIYELDTKTGLPTSKTPVTTGSFAEHLEETKFKVHDLGLYRVCVTAGDHAGNTSTKKCADVNVKKINVDIDGDGTNEFVDSDNSGCPDLNILLGKDKNGNTVKLNVAEKDKKYPYMNIDSNGDGKADLNIDTDHDGKPDLNLVILTEKDWVPKTCVVVDKLKDYTEPIEYCTGTDAKPSINVDIMNKDGDPIPDGIPDINIDNSGDMKPDINISKDGKTPSINMVKHTTWNPNRDFSVGEFTYDTEVLIPQYNIDSNGDGYPDINIDIDGDGIPDINIDTDGDFSKPETNIDTTGDGYPDTNLDPKGTGIPEKNIVSIDTWNPTVIIKGDKITYGTIKIPEKDELEDQGIVVKPSDPNGKFLPNFALKVNEITDTVDDKEKEEIKKNIDYETGEVKAVYDVQLLEDNKATQPNGTIEVKVPIDRTIQNPKVMMQDKNGTWKEVNGKIENGVFTFETGYIGKISVLGDKKTAEDPDAGKDPNPDNGTPIDPNDGTNQNPDSDPNGKPDGSTSNNDSSNTSSKNDPTTSVKGNYSNQTGNGMGGANTGDQTSIFLYLGSSLSALILLLMCYRNRKHKGKA